MISALGSNPEGAAFKENIINVIENEASSGG